MLHLNKYVCILVYNCRTQHGTVMILYRLILQKLGLGGLHYIDTNTIPDLKLVSQTAIYN